ncbi:Spo7-like protein-domain-containing protein [Lipomyces oligophaga]|uniref:Spo7-like protein-domain-containing protein n=1 Tax=Lipomyces oligophaga TaxID=45792 RepID=UPI0034CD3554
MSGAVFLASSPSSSPPSSPALLPTTSSVPSTSLPPTTMDPLLSAPSNPAQIYRNMMILEESLRLQHKALRDRRREYTAFCSLLALWTAYFYYSIFHSSSSSKVSSSFIQALQKLALASSIITFALFYLSGLYSKTIVIPRRFLNNTNKGLRQFNLKLVVIPSAPQSALLAVAIRSLRVYFYKARYRPRPPSPPALQQQISSHHPTRRRSSSSASSTSAPSSLSPKLPYYHYYIYHHSPPGGDLVKLVMLPKSFPPDVREAWELYRSEYWQKENSRRAARASGRIHCNCVYNS